MKSKKAITLISLIITIVLMIIIAGTTVGISLNRFKTNNLKKMYNDIVLLNDKIENYYIKFGGLPVLRDNNNIINYNYSELNFEKNTSDNQNYYIIDLNSMENIKLNYGKEGYEHPNESDDVYIINEKTHIIYYVKGIEDSTGKIHHSLNLNEIINNNTVGPTKPEIRILSKNDENMEIEIIPGKDSISGVQKTEYKVKSTDIENNVTETQNTEISERIVIGDLSINKAHEITATTTANSGATSENTLKINELIEKLDIGDYVNYSAHIPNVTLTSNSQIIQDLTTYSGNTDATQNTESTITQEKNMGWRVLDVKKGKLRLISATPTTSNISLYGYNGYNNCVYLLDEVCDTLYSSNKGKAQNLKIEDIEEKIDKEKFNYTQYSTSDHTSGPQYGKIAEYAANLYYPNIYPFETGCKAVSELNNNGTLGLSGQSNLIVGRSLANPKLIMTRTHWYNSNQMVETDFVNYRYYNLYMNDDSIYPHYWVSSRAVKNNANHAAFSIRFVGNCKVGAYRVFNSQDQEAGAVCVFRPVVTLLSNIEIGEKVDNVWQIN